MNRTPEELKVKIEQAMRMIAASTDKLTTDRLKMLLIDLEKQQKQH